MSTVFLRTLSVTLVFLGALFLPWWLSLFLAALFVFAFRNFYELLLLALFLDLLYGGQTHTVFGIPFFISLSGVVLYLLATAVKRRLFLYRSA